MNDSWQSGNPYERFMGRWSTPIAQEFLAWLAVPPASSWVDVGCGTGALTKCILENHLPTNIVAIDASPEFIAHAQQLIPNPTVQFEVGLAQSLPLDANTVDAIVSGIMLNFVPEPETAVSEMIRITEPGGTIGIFLWDYAEGMEMLRYFWDAAVELDANAKAFDEGLRFPLCQKGQLESLVRKVGLNQVETKAIEITAVFQNFDDYWQPFLGQVGPAPAYTMNLRQEDRLNLENKLRQSLPIAEDGTISLLARAWAIKSTI